MDFGYDEFGNRTSVTEDAVVRLAEYGGDANLEDGQAHPVYSETAAAGVGLEDSDSDFSDDVELVIGETAAQPMDQPLVEAAYVSSSGMKKADGVGMFLVEDRYNGSDAPTLLIKDGAANAPGANTTTLGSFMQMLTRIPSRTRNAALIGCLHHGKTALLNMLLGGGGYRQRSDEAAREMTLKSHVIATVSGGARLCPTSHCTTFVDTPGHPDFAGEVAAGLRLADVAIFCVDAVESVSAAGEAYLRQAVVRECLPVIVVVTKVDRLIIDLKLPPLDAYRKLRMVVDAVNNVIASCGAHAEELLVSPTNGTVCFSSAKLGFFFSLETFALKYADAYPTVDYAVLAQQLWGQVTLEGGSFKKITNFRQRPSFVALVLEPLYKIIAHAATGTGHQTLSADLKPLPRSPLEAMMEAVRLFCGEPSGEGLDAILSVLPCTARRSAWLAERYGLHACFHSGASGAGGVDADGDTSAMECEQLGGGTATTTTTTVAAIAPLLRLFADGELAAVVRVLRGTLAPGSVVALDEHSSEVDPFYVMKVAALYVRTVEGGYVLVDGACAGQVVYATGVAQRSGNHLVLVGGSAATAVIGATSASGEGEVEEGVSDGGSEWLDFVKVFPFECNTPRVHVSLELKNPAKLDALQRGLQTIFSTSPGIDVHREETGEFTMTGSGEVQLDTALHELRRGLCVGVKLGLSQPFVSFAETVLDDEGVLAVAGPRKTGIGCTAGAMSRSFTDTVEYGKMNFFPSEEGEVVQLWTTLRRDYGFDELDARHLMALGPDRTKGPSVLIDDTLEEETHSGPLSRAHRTAITSGFRASMASGPLIGGPVRGVGIKLIFADIEKGIRDTVVLSNTRTAVRQSLLGARPRLLEPVLSAEILCPPECTEQITDILRQRRGAVVGEEAVAAATLTRLKALVPAMDSFGLETQMRMLTHGQAFPFFSFGQWDVVPGDPYDASIHVAPMEPARGHALARDFVLKTRFRKGLPPSLMTNL